MDIKPSKTEFVTDLKSMLEKTASNYPDKVCYKFYRNKQIEEITFGDFKKYMDYIGTALCKDGLGNAHVAVIGETTPEWIASYMAVVNAGGVIVPLDRELAFDEIVNFINRSKAEVFVHSHHFTEQLKERQADMPNVKLFIEIPKTKFTKIENLALCDTLPDSKFIAFEDILNYGSTHLKLGFEEFINNTPDPEKLCAILFTSGTTGTSKGVMLCQKNICCSVNGARDGCRLSPDDVLMSVLPVHHTYEMSAGILYPLHNGMTVCINDSQKNLARNMKIFQPTAVAVVPLYVTTINKKIWDSAEKQGKADKLRAAIKASNLLRHIKIDLREKLFKSIKESFGGRLKYMVSGGAALNPELIDTFDAIGIELAQGYGITECAPIVGVVPFNKILKKKGSAGTPFPNIEIKIDCSENEDPDDKIGEILVSGNCVMLGYYDNPEATAAVFVDDENGKRWFRTGDYGYIDNDGYYYITGRKKNVIISSNGKNVFPEEIESYLEEIDLIEECVVVGKTADDGETVMIYAIVYPNEEVAESLGIKGDKDALCAKLKEEVAKINENLPMFKRIRNVIVRDTPFAKTSTRKIKRHEIEEISQINTNEL